MSSERVPERSRTCRTSVALEFQRYSALGVCITKIMRMITWEDDAFWKPKFTMTGFTAKRVSKPNYEGSANKVLQMWLSKTQGEINNYLYETYSLINGEIYAFNRKT